MLHSEIISISIKIIETIRVNIEIIIWGGNSLREIILLLTLFALIVVSTANNGGKTSNYRRMMRHIAIPRHWTRKI